MDTKDKDSSVEAPKCVNDEDDESKALLLPCKKGGLSKKTGKPKRKVQWNDTNGNKLAEVLEFEPRFLKHLKTLAEARTSVESREENDASDSDDDESDSCICRIM